MAKKTFVPLADFVLQKPPAAPAPQSPPPPRKVPLADPYVPPSDPANVLHGPQNMPETPDAQVTQAPSKADPHVAVPTTEPPGPLVA